MKTLSAIGLVLAFSLGNAYAQQCGSAANRLNQSELAILPGKTVCATFGANQWQEYHNPNGDLVDFKRGANHPVDPTTKVGTWAITGTGNSAQVQHTYGGVPYSFAIYGTKTGGNFDLNMPFDFCGSSNVTNASIKTGQVSCGF